MYVNYGHDSVKRDHFINLCTMGRWKETLILD